jgi:acyl-CoA thioester hydrolase
MASLGRDPDEPPHGLVVARLDVDYKRPILFRADPYVVETWVTRIGGSSFDLSCEIRDGEQVLSRARAVMVSFDRKSQHSRPLSDRERARLETVLEP